ncbi:hypothetical protein F5Y14DRAFT_448535 [Nemania sp. NC0429]|nr:hypothetical protein F5Y14DRAFT_448535 [Nemania sp. NC0429]
MNQGQAPFEQPEASQVSKSSNNKKNSNEKETIMPQFIFIELPTFRMKDKDGNTITLSSRHLGRIITLLQHVRSGLRTGGDYNMDLCASLLFSNQETNLCTAVHTLPQGHHAEENLLLSYFHSFDSPGAYPIVDAMLLTAKPCRNCMEYFSLGGKQLRPLDDGTGTGTMTAAAPFRAKFTPRVDKSYTPVFYLSRSLGDAQRSNLWLQLAQMWTGSLGGMGVALSSSPAVQRGEMYYLFADGSMPWYALNGQENMSDVEVAEAITRQGLNPAYWIGR